ncbi:MAG: hypothetical protein GY730_12085 [bacterium]|nr:hypothetical protein [bacterium]
MVSQLLKAKKTKKRKKVIKIKVKELQERLSQANPNNTVVINNNNTYYDFSGLSFDDNNDIELYVTGNDKKFKWS